MNKKKELPIQSMTGFGSASTTVATGQLTIEIRGVNHRYFDFNFRAPEFLRFYEPTVRDGVQKVFNRGRCEVGIRWREGANAEHDIAVNEEVLNGIAALAETTRDQYPGLNAMSVSDVLSWPGVIKSNELSNEEWLAQVSATCRSALEQVKEARTQEGARLKGFMLEKLDAIDVHTEAAAQRIPFVKEHYKARSEERLSEVAEQIDNDRLEQELVIFANKIDVTEEIDRLASHQKAFRTALNNGGVIGRRLDFLLQEINREVNTLASKSADAEQTSHAVEMKVLIEQIREQVQNIE